VSEAEALVRRVMDAHNRGGDVLLAAYDDIFAPDFEFKPITVGTVGSTERVTYCGREGMERYYRERVSGATVEEDITLVYWVRDGRVIRGEAFRSGQDALDAAHA
jgi:hypothetical protein